MLNVRGRTLGVSHLKVSGGKRGDRRACASILIPLISHQGGGGGCRLEFRGQPMVQSHGVLEFSR